MVPRGSENTTLAPQGVPKVLPRVRRRCITWQSIIESAVDDQPIARCLSGPRVRSMNDVQNA